YPAVELTSGVWAVLLALKFGPGPEWAVFMLFGAIFIIASFIDLESFLLPDILTIPGTLLAVLAATFVLPGPETWDARLLQSLLGLAVGGGLFLVLHYGYRLLRGVDGLGLGDVKLMCLIGALLTAMALPFVVIVGAVVALLASVFWMIGSKKGGKTPIPFGPFLSLAAMTWILCGPEVWQWYLGAMR
ncbi:MAG: A24 family peptidase, partial [Proteobacteria bacterium]|nr:A24 family peptidase [Pseudomonadota bacterium]